LGIFQSGKAREQLLFDLKQSRRENAESELSKSNFILPSTIYFTFWGTYAASLATRREHMLSISSMRQGPFTLPEYIHLNIKLILV
jgi:hypothetical protein